MYLCDVYDKAVITSRILLCNGYKCVYLMLSRIIAISKTFFRIGGSGFPMSTADEKVVGAEANEMEVDDLLTEETTVEVVEGELLDKYEKDDPDDWEEVTMVVTVNGILDADLVRDAVEKDLMRLRYADTDAPVLQINNSLYTAAWNQDLGTNIVLQSVGKEMEVISCTSTMMTAEKALLTSLSTEGSTIAAKAEIAPRAALSRTQPRGK